MNLLHIDSSITEAFSITRQLSREVVNTLTEAGSFKQVAYRDLVKDEIGHLTGKIAAGFRSVPGRTPVSTEQAAEYQVSNTLIKEFLESDVIVIGAPMYNFSVSSQLKAWMDRIAQPGKTFSYTANGPVGLSGGKKVIIVSARGGFYHNTSLEKMDFQERYLRQFMAFLGIERVEFIRAEGASKSEEMKQQEIARAMTSIPQVVNTILNHEE
ncbi:FMN-dependent NADH-azoreductase [Lelliottia amnigena]|uniref:FMN-dependent NADH-azoreductase n=1 Tax=Lelliottia amnigena TaxID=61646 RepID=UPI00195BD70D|nr:NAD(P)H-dependent oxidoreductase [Lelliottia amnigena]MBM7355780.1 FMN-dependent NADH-azoreductase [Lelliottia amnigena]WSO18106.1 NAD(P)H-dependent oxidoreductase [Lelliottia amnigena]